MFGQQHAPAPVGQSGVWKAPRVLSATYHTQTLSFGKDSDCVQLPVAKINHVSPTA
jgi:hypothetical protein